MAERRGDSLLQELYGREAECADSAAAKLTEGLPVPELWWSQAQSAEAAAASMGESLLLQQLWGPPWIHGAAGVGARAAPGFWAAPASARSSGTDSKSLRQQPAQASSLQAVMQEISEVDPDSVVLVRKIKRMGFSSRRLLRDHFSRFGAVAKVLMAHSRLKGSEQPRLRPASLGFVVMGSSAEAERVFAAGSTQEVAGVSIDVLRFVRRGVGVSKDSDREQDQDELPEEAVELGSVDP